MANFLPLTVNSAVGGMATDKKVGIKHSFAYSQSLDFRSKPSQFSVLPAPDREDNNVVTDLILNSVIVNNGTIYGIGDTGKLYKRTTSGVWSLYTELPASYFGLLYRQDQDAMYTSHATTVSLINKVNSGFPVGQPNFYAASKSFYNNSTNVGFNVSAFQDGSTNTTLIGTTIVEGDPSSRYFQTDIEPLTRNGLNIADKGTGDWTITLHDGLNNLLGSVTVTNANLTSNQMNYFDFAAPIRAQVAPSAQTYHIHVTSTVNDGTVYSTITNDLSSCDLEVWADRLVQTVNGLHPMETFQQFMVIGNGRYLSVVELLGSPEPSNSEWQRHKLQFPPSYEVCSLAVFNEYLAIGCEQVSSDGTIVPGSGVIFFWDGLSTTYNYFMATPEGSPYALDQYKNVIYYIAGGAKYAIGSVTSQPQKVRTLPFGENAYSVNNTSTKVYPYATTVRNGVLLTAWPSVTNNEDIPYGVYSWGQVDETQPLSFGYSYIISTGTQYRTNTNNLTIGMVKNFGDTLLISWRDGSDYGIDVVNSNSTPASYSTYESLIFDAGYVAKEKLAAYVETTYLDMPDNVDIVLKYKVDRQEWNYSERFSATNLYLDTPRYARLPIGQFDSSGNLTAPARFREIEFGIDIYCDDATESPAITSLSLVYDPLTTEVLQ